MQEVSVIKIKTYTTQQWLNYEFLEYYDSYNDGWGSSI